MILVTGAAGMIGSNLIRSLNADGYANIIAVDNLFNGKKIQNLSDLKIYDYFDKSEFLALLENQKLNYKFDKIFHQGACSATTEWNGQYMMQNNYTYSKALLHLACMQEAKFVYASSASVYGSGENGYSVRPESEKPLNVYGYSKLMFDNYVRQQKFDPGQTIIGLRYFNVYGPNEQHKEGMASTIFHFTKQLQGGGKIKLFGAYDGYEPGEQKRDFVYVKDVISVNRWASEKDGVQAIFNVGTGKAHTFNEVAHAILRKNNSSVDKNLIEYLDFPEALKGSYQSFTCADLSELRSAGYELEFMDITTGVNAYYKAQGIG